MTETAKKDLDLWVEERQQEILGIRYRVSRTLYSAESPFQRIAIVETPGFGRMLFNDGVVMVSERDEFIYHEMIAHVPMFVHPGVERVLVIGGGDGGTVREVIRHASVQHVRLVEIDPCVLEGCREHLRQMSCAFDDPRVEVTVADGVQFVAETEEQFDLVIVDSTDPVGPATPLFGDTFYRNVHRILADDGLVVSQAESCFYELEMQTKLVDILAAAFPQVQLYNYSNLTYPGGLWSFSIAGKRGGWCPVGRLDPVRVESTGLDFRYYSAAVHRAAFALPTFQRRALGDRLTALQGET